MKLVVMKTEDVISKNKRFYMHKYVVVSKYTFKTQPWIRVIPSNYYKHTCNNANVNITEEDLYALASKYSLAIMLTFDVKDTSIDASINYTISGSKENTEAFCEEVNKLS